MSRYIDADEFKRINKRLLHCDFPYLCELTLEELLDEIPTADVVPVAHGKWCFSEIDDIFFCTNCKNGSVRNDYPHCHWCGAKMDEVTE